MKKYVNSVSQLLDIQYANSECSCYKEFGLDEDFLCDLCRSRLKQSRTKVKRKQRQESKAKHKKFKY